MNIPPVEFASLKKQALERAADLGWKVVVVDFADSDNVYNHWDRVQELERRCKEGQVMIFHENVMTPAHIENLQHARANIQAIGRGLLCITSFDLDEMTRVSEELAGSPYWNIWITYSKTHAESDYLFDRLKLLRTLAGSILSTPQDITAINIVGPPRAGKTNMLYELTDPTREKRGFFRRETDTPPIGDYFDLQRLVGVRVDEQYSAITQAVMGDVLVLDEADLVTLPLHRKFQKQYKLVIYASHRRLSFVDAVEFHVNYKATLQTP